jgi:cytochrome P450
MSEVGMDEKALLCQYSPYDKRFGDADYRFDLLRYARSECPIWHSDAHGGYWIVSNYALASQVLQDVETFRSGEGVTVPHNPAAPIMPPIDTDPPAHRAWRRLLNPYVSPTALAPRRAEMQEIARGLVDQFVAQGHCDIMADYSEPLSALILANVILGVDDADEVREVQRNNHDISAGMDSESGQKAFVALRQHVEKLVAERQRHPRDNDIVTGVLTGSIEKRPVSEEEAINCLMILYLGGLDTVSDAIGSISYRIALDPALVNLVRDAHWFQERLDEFLRLDSPVSNLARTASRDTDLGGEHIAKGDQVLVSYLSANRDESEFDASEDLDFDRARSRHLAFGLGPHRCVGSHLARIELEVAFEELFNRIDQPRLANQDPITWKTGLSYGPRSLQLVFATLQPA